jgi:hypothetical protein
MRGAIPPLPQYAPIAWCSVEAQGQIYFYLLQCFVLFISFSTTKVSIKTLRGVKSQKKIDPCYLTTFFLLHRLHGVR